MLSVDVRNGLESGDRICQLASMIARVFFGAMLVTAAVMLNARDASGQTLGRNPPMRSKDCPAEELSCGRQKPMRSDGIHSFDNRDMGLSVLFPRGALVCRGRSGDAPRGFYTWLSMPTNCAELKSSNPAAYMGIHASWNSLFWKSPKQSFAVADCKPLSGSLAKRVRSLSLPQHRFEICRRAIKKGVELSLVALAGPKCDGIPAVEYNLFLGTTWPRFDADLKRFERFLHRARIGNVAVKC